MKLFTIREVADAMKVSDKTVRRLIKRGHLIAYKVGDRGQLRVKDLDIEAYLEEKKVRIDDGLENDDTHEEKK